MPVKLPIIFEGRRAYLHGGTYTKNQRMALWMSRNPDPEATEDQEYMLTTNLVNDSLEPGEFFVKTWSENEELAPACMASGHFIDTGKRVPTGWCEAQVWRLV